MSNFDTTRRTLLLGGLAMMTSGCMSLPRPTAQNATEQEPEPSLASAAAFTLAPELRKQRVPYYGSETPGTIVVNTQERFLYFVEPEGWATRYGVGVGEQGLTFKGLAEVGRKAEWPSWTPTQNMMRRKPELLQYASGVAGGLNNPLGARALYLYRNGRDSMYRLHGTNEPWTIGTAVSSGCVRLTNEAVIDLYERTPVGTKVLVI